MAIYRYIRDGESYRNWGPDFELTIGPMQLERVISANEGEQTSWPFLLYVDIDTVTLDQALAIGRGYSEIAANVAVLASGHRFELGTEGVRPKEPTEEEPPGKVIVPAVVVYRVDVAGQEEQEHLREQVQKSSLPTGDSEGDELIRRALRWYKNAVNEDDSIDKFIKLFVTLDMLVPRRKGVAFIDRAADALKMDFTEVDRSLIRSALADIWTVRNDMLHEGKPNVWFSVALQILERIVRASLRRKVKIPDERPVDEIFKRLSDHALVSQEGGPWVHADFWQSGASRSSQSDTYGPGR